MLDCCSPEYSCCTFLHMCQTNTLHSGFKWDLSACFLHWHCKGCLYLFDHMVFHQFQLTCIFIKQTFNFQSRADKCKINKIYKAVVLVLIKTLFFFGGGGDIKIINQKCPREGSDFITNQSQWKIYNYTSKSKDLVVFIAFWFNNPTITGICPFFLPIKTLDLE